MIYLTKNFGEIDVDESKVIMFQDGIPGFFHCKSFILFENGHEESPEETRGVFWWLQSLDDPSVAFVLMNVFAVLPEYNPTINTHDIADLGEYIREEFLVYNIAVIPEDITQMSVNLKAPIVINTLSRLGKQIIATNEDYSVRYRIFEELNNRR